MMNRIKIYTSALCLVLSVLGIQAQVQIKLPYPKFVSVVIPDSISDERDRDVWLAQHYWDKFNFANPENTKNPELAIPIISNYISVLDRIPESVARQCFGNLLSRSKANSDMYKYVANTLNDLLGGTVSPYRDDELLIMVLEDLLSSPEELSDEDNSRYAMNLAMASKNRIGTVAANIGYIDVSNHSDSLYNIKADYTLLMFYSPGCHACEIVEAQIQNSELISNWIESGDLKVLAYAPESTVDAWKDFQSKIPASWINGYDPDQSVWYKRIYDIQGFPTLYLLDKNKRVILKDTGVKRLENYLMEQAMTLPAMP